MAASRTILRAVEGLGGGDLLVYLISGGSSSLFEVPAPGLAADDLIEAYDLLLGCGAPIADVNAIRSVLSAVKAGGLARAAYPARVLTLAVSDVIGDEAAVIGSGPTVAAPPRTSCTALAAKWGLTERLPSAVVDRLHRAPLSGAPTAIVDYVVVASNRTARRAAERALERRGYRCVPAPLDPLAGDVDAAAGSIADAVEAHVAESVRWAFVAGGETTVELTAAVGNGGRNRHLACRLACLLDGVERFSLLCAGTDGVDGAGPAAGAVIDGASAARMRDAGHDPARALARFDAGTALAAAGDAVQTGPTGTNVGDLVIAVGAAAP
jgi:glycerate-2-kinase